MNIILDENQRWYFRVFCSFFGSVFLMVTYAGQYSGLQQVVGLTGWVSPANLNIIEFLYSSILLASAYQNIILDLCRFGITFGLLYFLLKDLTVFEGRERLIWLMFVFFNIALSPLFVSITSLFFFIAPLPLLFIAPFWFFSIFAVGMHEGYLLVVIVVILLRLCSHWAIYISFLISLFVLLLFSGYGMEANTATFIFLTKQIGYILLLWLILKPDGDVAYVAIAGVIGGTALVFFETNFAARMFLISSVVLLMSCLRNGVNLSLNGKLGIGMLGVLFGVFRFF